MPSAAIPAFPVAELFRSEARTPAGVSKAVAGEKRMKLGLGFITGQNLLLDGGSYTGTF